MQSESSKIIAKLQEQQFHLPNGDAKLLGLRETLIKSEDGIFTQPKRH
jgi:hypothetical protein